MKVNYNGILIGIIFVLVASLSVVGGAYYDRYAGLDFLDQIIPRSDGVNLGVERNVAQEESVVINVVEESAPSVVTVSIQTQRRRVLEFNPFGGFSQRFEGGTPQDIGSGFIISEDGLIVTNKHVVSQEGAEYSVITSDDVEYSVTEITRDPANDLAIIKIDTKDQKLKPLKLGDSSNLKVGQFVIAIGTALGEFRSTVTTGVVSGLGRGIVAGSAYEGFVERLDDVIQTDAAINPGNSGGPLLNSSGEVIGVNVAVAAGAENIGFAIPVNIVKKGLESFEDTGAFASKPFLGVSYQMIPQRAALLNNVPQGALVLDVVADSAAARAGIEIDDIITRFNGQNLNEDNPLADAISELEVGDSVDLTVWRSGEEINMSTTLTPSQ